MKHKRSTDTRSMLHAAIQSPSPPEQGIPAVETMQPDRRQIIAALQLAFDRSVSEAEAPDDDPIVQALSRRIGQRVSDAELLDAIKNKLGIENGDSHE